MYRRRVFSSARAAVLFFIVTCGPAEPLATQIESIIESSDAEVVAVYYQRVDRTDSLFVNADVRMHAASMMKVPVMIRLYDLVEAGRISLHDSVPITNTFSSIVDGSLYEMTAPSDSDTLLYQRVGTRESIGDLIERMITVSSNLATNILMEVAGPRRTTLRMRDLGADSIQVLRGVEDIKAFEMGLSNSTTARDLGIIFLAIAEGRACKQDACDAMIGTMSRQVFDGGIPRGVPETARVAHKTGSITEIRHDGGIVFPETGEPYVLVLLTRGMTDAAYADHLIADISRRVYEHATRDR